MIVEMKTKTLTRESAAKLFNAWGWDNVNLAQDAGPDAMQMAEDAFRAKYPTIPDGVVEAAYFLKALPPETGTPIYIDGNTVPRRRRRVYSR